MNDLRLFCPACRAYWATCGVTVDETVSLLALWAARHSAEAHDERGE